MWGGERKGLREQLTVASLSRGAHRLRDSETDPTVPPVPPDPRPRPCCSGASGQLLIRPAAGEEGRREQTLRLNRVARVGQVTGTPRVRHASGWALAGGQLLLHSRSVARQSQGHKAYFLWGAADLSGCWGSAGGAEPEPGPYFGRPPPPAPLQSS